MSHDQKLGRVTPVPVCYGLANDVALKDELHYILALVLTMLFGSSWFTE